MAVGYVINASQLEQAERTREQLQEALDSRIIIEQAKGIVANANRISIDDAFTVLRRYARSQRAPLRAVATGGRRGDDPPHLSALVAFRSVRAKI